MKRRIGTALSVLGLLAVGTAAAAVNVRMLHSAGTESAQFQMTNTGDVTPLGQSGPESTTATPNPVDGNLLGATDSSTVTKPRGHNGGPAKPLGSVGSVNGDGDGFVDDDGDDDRHGFGPDDAKRPPLTEAQMTLLRVSAMVRTDPQTVRAVARGENTHAALLAAVKQAATVIGTTLKDLAAVENLPPAHDRGHGGHGEHHGGKFGVDTATATLNTYDD